MPARVDPHEAATAGSMMPPAHMPSTLRILALVTALLFPSLAGAQEPAAWR